MLGKYKVITMLSGGASVSEELLGRVEAILGENGYIVFSPFPVVKPVEETGINQIKQRELRTMNENLELTKKKIDVSDMVLLCNDYENETSIYATPNPLLEELISYTKSQKKEVEKLSESMNLRTALENLKREDQFNERRMNVK